MPLLQKSPIFCSLLPFAAPDFAASSLISLVRLRFSSKTRLPIPQDDCSLGIGFFLIQPPLAYSKKSSDGRTFVSRLENKISSFVSFFSSFELQEISIAASAKHASNCLIINFIFYKCRISIHLENKILMDGSPCSYS